jgi:replicative DNA helicase
LTDPTAAEHAVIGCALLDPGIVDLVALPSSSFVGVLARRCWQAILDLREAGEPVDPILVADRSGCRDLLGFCGARLVETSTAANAEHHADLVRRADLTRTVRAAAAEILAASDQRAIEGDELLGEALRLISSLSSDSRSTATTIGDLATARYMEHGVRQDALALGDPGLTGYPTGVAELDELLGGISPGIVTIVAGRPGHGKSAFAMTITRECVAGGSGVHVFSLEDLASAYADRILSRVSRVPVEALRRGRLLALPELRDLRAGVEGLRRTRGWIVDDRCAIDAAEIVRSVRRMRREIDTRVAIVDYIQLLRRQPRMSMHEHLGTQIGIFADAAKTDKIAYVVLSQLSRAIESRDDRTPRLSDLRESGSLEERAKAVIGLHRASAYDQRASKDTIEIVVLKNSQGRTGKVEAHFDGPTIEIR